MTDRVLHPREEAYRWVIDKLDTVFGRDRVRLRPRNHHHIISAAVSDAQGGRTEELALRNPTYDLNRQGDRESILESWIAQARRKFETAKPAAAKRRSG